MLMLIWVVVTFFTVAAFFLLDIEKVYINFWRLFFVLLTEFVLCGGLYYTMTQRNLFASAGLYTALTLYAVLAFGGCFFIDIFDGRLGVFIVYELAVAGMLIMIASLILVFDKKIQNDNRRAADYLNSQNFNIPKRGDF